MEVEAEQLPEVIANVEPAQQSPSKKKVYTTVTILFFVNLLNYMDRFTIAGVLQNVQRHFDIVESDTLTGLIQTSFVISYMIFSPVVGFLGDRYSRKWLMAFGILFWCAVALSGSFVHPGKHNYAAFLVLRALVGVGEASYSTIAPTIIADLCVHDQRTHMLMFFYFAIPVGSGLGYIVGTKVTEWFGNWQWSLRVTPAFGVVCVICIVLLVQDPPRGQAEGHKDMRTTSLLEDLRYLRRNKSFLLSTFGFTSVAFVAGSLSLWAPKFIKHAYFVAEQRDIKDSDVGLYFGIVTVATGFLGVAVGAEASRRMRKYTPRGDPLVCAVGLLGSGPCLFLALVVARYNVAATFVLIFIGEFLLFLNWSIVPDILLYVVIPTRRSIAEAGQILVSHALGDAGSPFFMGLISDAIRGDAAASIGNEFTSLQQALYCCAFICVIGGGFFLINALYVLEDRNKAERESAQASERLINSDCDEPTVEHDDPTFGPVYA